MPGYIPLEVQEEILKWLPVKSLIQFRSVSKPWKSFIDSPKFTAAYGVRETHPNLLIIRYQVNYRVSRCIAFVDNDDDDSFIKQDFAPIPDFIKKFDSGSYVVGSSYSGSYVVGSSNGLLCIDYYDNDIVVLWNPSISKSIGIEIPYMHDPDDEDGLYIGVDHVFGFGVCPVTFDPTIVKIEYCFESPWKVGVFTLSTRTWSILSTNMPCDTIKLERDQVVIDRFIYWVALAAQVGRSQLRFLIMSFDLTAKEFKEINLTNSLTNQLHRIETISKLRESLVLLAYHREFEEDLAVCSLWMMKEQGLTRSFTKLYNINLLPDVTIQTFLGFRKTGEIIMTLQQQNKEVQIYDPNSEAIGDLGFGGKGYNFFMGSYMETLILHDQLDGFIYWLSN